jgi:hypothetical protein
MSTTRLVNLTLGKTICFGSLEFTAVFVGMVHTGPPSLHTSLDDSFDEGGIASSVGLSFGPPTLLRVQCDNPDHPHHHHTDTGERFSTSDHPNGHGADYGTSARYGVPPNVVASLPGGAASVDPCSVGQR